MTTVEQRTGSTILPFHMEISGEALDDLRRRIAATRWPGRELVDDRSQGVQLATIQEVARYWMSDYDMRRCQERLNALPQFTTAIDGVDVHFVHVRSPHPDALPLIMTHGWPGSVLELLDAVGPLTDPPAHGGRPEDAFHLVLPSIPGYGCSAEPAELGWDPGRIGRAWDQLMHRLGYDRYVAQGGDLGAYIVDVMGRQAPEGLLGIHTNLLVAMPADGSQRASDTDEERTALAAIAERQATGLGYFTEQATRPQTIGYPQVDSPVALAAWLLDHDTDSYEKIRAAFLDGRPAGNLTRDNVLDNITLYWLTGTGASAARAYWETGQAQARAGGHAPPPVTVPAAFTAFPGEAFVAPRRWLEQAYPTLGYYNRADRGGHFAAWEEPGLFAEELRAAFAPLRAPQIPGPRKAPGSSSGSSSMASEPRAGLPADLREGYADIGDQRLHYVEAGEGPLVVLLHGFPEFWFGWRAQIAPLAAAGFHVVAPDTRGYNLSSRPHEVAAYDTAALAEDIAGLIRERGAESAMLVGHDWGGTLAWTLAMNHPEVVDRLAILNAAHPRKLSQGLHHPGQLRRSWYFFFFDLPDLPEAVVHANNWHFFRHFLHDARPALTPEETDRYIQAWSQPGAATGMINYYRASVRTPPKKAEAALRPIQAPTLVIWGDADSYLGSDLAEPEHDDVPDLRVERLPGASHWVHHDEAERVTQLLTDFFAPALPAKN